MHRQYGKAERMDFNYQVTNKDQKGLVNIFLQQARKEGFEGTVKNWNAVLSIFKEIQQEKQAEGEKLYSGGSEAKDWHKNFVIKSGDIIKLTQEQLNKIYKAMGFEKEKPATSVLTSGSSSELTGEEGVETLSAAETSSLSIDTADIQKKSEQRLQEVFAKEQASYSEVKKAFDAIPSALTAYVVNNYDGLADEIKNLSWTTQQTLAADKLMDKLCQRAKELGISTKGMKPLGADLATRLDNIQKLSEQIIEKEKEVGTIQTVFDKSAALLQKFISMDPKPEITYDKNNYKGGKVARIRFEDGGFIYILFDNKNKISSIGVSYEKNETDIGDTAEVIYKPDGIYYANASNKFTAGYDFANFQKELEPFFAEEEK